MKLPKRVLLVAGGGAAVVAATAITVSAFAASPSPSPSSSAGQKSSQYCQGFLGHLAANLGKTQAQVSQALQQARNQTIDDAVKNGDLTQAQADKIKSALAGQPQCAPGFRGFGPGFRLPGFGLKGMAGAGSVVFDDAAKVLGMTSDQLRTDLKNGQTIQQLITAKGMDMSTFQNNLADQVKADLDPKVKSGEITQSQEDQVVSTIRSGQLHLGGGRKPAPPAPPATPATPTP